jgi:hypothetical protein
MRLGTACLAAMSLAACNGGSSTPCRPVAVARPILLTPVMVQPAPGATGVPTTGLQVAIRNGDDSKGELLRLVDQNGATLTGGLFQPAASPAGAPQAYDHVAAAPQLAPHTTYQAFVDGAFPAFGCNPADPFSFSIGTFTTQ